MERFLRVYWIIYFLGYLIAAAIMLWLHWASLLNHDQPVYLLTAIFGAAAGSASAFAIIVEGVVRVMLLIPPAVRNLINKGRMEMNARYREAYRRFGIEVDGVRALPDTPEVQAFLNGETGDSEPGK